MNLFFFSWFSLKWWNPRLLLILCIYDVGSPYLCNSNEPSSMQIGQELTELWLKTKTIKYGVKQTAWELLKQLKAISSRLIFCWCRWLSQWNPLMTLPQWRLTFLDCHNPTINSRRMDTWRIRSVVKSEIYIYIYIYILDKSKHLNWQAPFLPMATHWHCSTEILLWIAVNDPAFY